MRFELWSVGHAVAFSLFRIRILPLLSWVLFIFASILVFSVWAFGWSQVSGTTASQQILKREFPTEGIRSISDLASFCSKLYSSMTLSSISLKQSKISRTLNSTWMDCLRRSSSSTCSPFSSRHGRIFIIFRYSTGCVLFIKESVPFSIVCISN